MGLTELVFILDKSGSMGGLEDDTIGGYNALLAKQREVEGLCLVTTVLFDHGYEVLHERLELSHVQPLTRREYQVGVPLLCWMPWDVPSRRWPPGKGRMMPAKSCV